MRSLQQLHELGDVKNLLKENPQTEIRGWIRLARMQLEKVLAPHVGRSTLRSEGV
jgi:glutaredoxin 2